MTASAELFKEFIEEAFIETGAGTGDGIQHALDAGFMNIKSIELDRLLCAKARARFKDLPFVQINEGDSRIHLSQILLKTNFKSTIWLDAHYSGDETAGKDDRFPLITELDIIKGHKKYGHNILIDDIRYLGTPYFYNITLQEVKDKVLEIDKNYKFGLRDGLVKEDILVCYTHLR